MVSKIIGWFFTPLILLLFVSMALIHNWLPALVLLLLLIIVLPVTSDIIKEKLDLKRFPLYKALAIVLLFTSFVLLLRSGQKSESIYKDQETRSRFHSLYAEKMSGWPIPYEDLFLDTEYGTVHVIKSGDPELPPLMLLHASGVGSWSWKYNVEELSRFYQIFAVDTIGDAGLSEYGSLDKVMETGEDQARLYSEIADQLGLESAAVVGASEGGFIASNFALYAPERVEKIVLLGPMGYSGAGGAVFRITMAQLFPLKPFQISTFNWAFSRNKELQREFEEWFILLMEETAPKKVAPLPLKPEQRRAIKVPVYFIFGERDNLVGDPRKAVALVQDIPGVKTDIVDTGHLVGAEKPAEVTSMILDFLRE